MENSNISFTTSGGFKVELRPFITGRQKRHIADSFLEDVDFTQESGKQSFSIGAMKANIATDRAIEAVVVSVEGGDPAKSIVDQVLDLPAKDSDEILAKVEEVTAEKKDVPATPGT